MEMILAHMVWVWVAVMALAAFIEAATPMLVSIWFSVGALAAMLAAYFGASLTVQLLLFVFVSIAALVGLRPLARRFIDPHIVPTNADRLLGGEAQVTETIDNDRAAGAVYIDGKTWTARSADDTVIPAGTQVRIERMEGVKLLVRELSQTGSEKKEEENVQ